MLLVSSLCLFEFLFSVQFCNKQKHSSKTSSKTLVCQSYNQRDHPRLVRQEGPQKSNKDVGMSGRVHAIFLFFNSMSVLLSHPCSFLISISSFGLCANFPSRDATFGTSGCLSFYSLVILCVQRLLVSCSFPRRLQKPQKKKKWGVILVQHGVKEQYQVFTGSASRDSEIRKAFEFSVQVYLYNTTS